MFQKVERKKLEVKAGAVFYAILLSKAKINVLEGGTGSGKTWGLLYNIIFNICHKEEGQVITIARRTFKEMKSTVIRDFYSILEKFELYNEDNDNRTDHTYQLNSNTIEFVGLDQQKFRGARRDYLYINEANELRMDDWVQLLPRTRKTIWIDYNPTFMQHEVLDMIIGLPGTNFIKSNYLDNWDFLSQNERDRIVSLAAIDPFYEKTMVKGERSMLRGQVFTNWSEVPEWPEGIRWFCYGLDFGFTNSNTALMKVGYKDIGELYIEEVIYDTGLTNLPAPGVVDKNNLHSRMLEAGLTKKDEIYADSARTDSIEELKRAGWNIKPVEKVKDSIMIGIEIMKRYTIKLVAGGKGLKKEFQFYKWKEDEEQTGGFANVPVDKFNDCMDAVRYVALQKLPKPVRKRFANV